MFDQNKIERFQSRAYRTSYMSNRVRTAIATQVRALREQFSQTQRNFSALIGKKQSVISRLENPNYGKMSVNTLLDIAEALDIALLVKFVSYDVFFEHLDDEDVTLSALQVDPFREKVQSREEDINLVSEGIKKEVGAASSQYEFKGEEAGSVVFLASAKSTYDNIEMQRDKFQTSSVRSAA